MTSTTGQPRSAATISAGTLASPRASPTARVIATVEPPGDEAGIGLLRRAEHAARRHRDAALTGEELERGGPLRVARGVLDQQGVAVGASLRHLRLIDAARDDPAQQRASLVG